MAALDSGVQSGTASVLTQAIAGLGGVGKSQIATAYAHAHKASYDLIHWLTADPETSLLDGFRELGRLLHLPVDASPDISTAVRMVLSWLARTERRWLLIIDNVDEMSPSRLRQYLPASGNGHVLITSRNPAWQGIVDSRRLHTVDLFTPDEAVAYLEKELNRPDRFSKPVGSQLAEALGYLPLALTHAAGYMTTQNKTCADYLRLFNTPQTHLLKRHAAPNDYHATIMSTWQLAFDALQHTPGATDILYLCSCLAPDNIPLNLLERLGEVRDTPLKDELQREDALAALRRYSLIELADGGLNIHRLVQLVAQTGMAERERLGDWLESAAGVLRKAYPFDKYDMTTWPLAAALLPHLEAVAEWAADQQLASEDIAYINNAIGYYFNQLISSQLAKPYYERALAINEKVLGSEHPDTATNLNNLGFLLRAMGAYEEARPYYERALTIREAVLGSEHPDTAGSLNNLGFLLDSMGAYEEARPYYERALAIREAVLGSEHPDTAYSLNNLAWLHFDMGQVAQAVPLMRRALAIFESRLGANHPNTVTVRQNLTHIESQLGNS